MGSPRSGTLFAFGLAATALHALDDAVIHREPGVSVADHAVPILAVLAVLAAAALAWRRLAPGWRGAIALTLVVPVAAGFALAVSDVSARGASGDDWTGLLLGPAALALLAAGIAELLAARRSWGRPTLRRTAKAAGALLFAFWVVVPVTMAVVATHRPRGAEERLALGGPARDVTLHTSDGLALAASYVPSRNGAAVVLFPRRGGTQRQARVLVRHGYGVLSVDMRGYGASEGDPNAYGWGATRDIDAAVRWLGRRPDVRAGAIGGLGLSVGGEQMLEAAASNPALRAVVSEGAGERSVRETLIRGVSGALVLPQQAVQTAAVGLLSATRPPPALDDAVARISPRALLLIEAAHGGGGEELNADYLAAAGEPKALWRAPGGHTDAIAAAPREYERRVVGFFDRALQASG